MSRRGSFKPGKEVPEEHKVVKKGQTQFFLMFFCLPISNHLPTELSWVISAMTRPPIQGCKWKGAWSCPGQIQVLNLLAINIKMW